MSLVFSGSPLIEYLLDNTDIESLVAINENDSHVITHSLDVGNEHSRENTLEQEANILQSDDPWLQRKMALAGFTG